MNSAADLCPLWPASAGSPWRGRQACEVRRSLWKHSCGYGRWQKPPLLIIIQLISCSSFCFSCGRNQSANMSHEWVCGSVSTAADPNWSSVLFHFYWTFRVKDKSLEQKPKLVHLTETMEIKEQQDSSVSSISSSHTVSVINCLWHHRKKMSSSRRHHLKVWATPPMQILRRHLLAESVPVVVVRRVNLAEIWCHHDNHIKHFYYMFCVS